MNKKQVPAIFFLVLAGVGTSQAAQPAGKHAPDFTLTISTKEETVTSQNHMNIGVNVEEKNISNHIISVGRPSDPARWYAMSVLLDLNPAPFTTEGKRSIAPKPYDPNAPVTMDSFLGTLKPGQIQSFAVSLTAYFDLSSSGQYEITFSRGTDPGQPDNVVVQSNTITITVLPAGAPSPESGSTSPPPNAPGVFSTPSSATGQPPRPIGSGTLHPNPSASTAEYIPSVPPSEKPKPTFTLSIEQDNTEAQIDPALHRVLVTFANISPSFIVNQFHPEALNMYNIVVLRNGVPAPETDTMKALEQYRKVDRYPTIRHPFALKPGQTLTTSLDVGDHYAQ